MLGHLLGAGDSSHQSHQIYLLAPPHSVPIRQSSVSLHILYTPTKLIFLKHHFAHVTTLLKTNLWGYFCT